MLAPSAAATTYAPPSRRLTLVDVQVLFYRRSVKSQLQPFGQSFRLLAATGGEKITPSTAAPLWI